MSWQTINKVLGLAMVDAQFARRLLANPLSTIRDFDFDLTEEEQDILSQVNASDLSELSQILVERFAEKTLADCPDFAQNSEDVPPERDS